MKLTLCGSTRVSHLFDEAHAALSLAGHIVQYARAFESISADQRMVLELVQLQRIADCDGIVVLGWIPRPEDLSVPATTELCDDTRRAVLWASMLDKSIYTESDLDSLIAAGPFATLERVPGTAPPTL